MHVRSKHFLNRNRFVGGFVNIKIFSCPSKLCIVDLMEDSQFTNGFFLSDAQVSQVRGRTFECQQRGLEFLPVFLFPPQIWRQHGSSMDIGCGPCLPFRYPWKDQWPIWETAALVQDSSVPFNNLVSTYPPWPSASPFKMEESQWWYVVIFGIHCLVPYRLQSTFIELPCRWLE